MSSCIMGGYISSYLEAIHKAARPIS